MAQVTDALNRQVANWTVLYTKLHSCHWYVTGPDFFTLHAKFEELYDEAALHMDELAERILALGGRPVATMAGGLSAASVKEAAGSESPKQMITQITSDFSQLIAESKEAIGLAEGDHDAVTADLLTSIAGSLEKHVWMLSAFAR